MLFPLTGLSSKPFDLMLLLDGNKMFDHHRSVEGGHDGIVSVRVGFRWPYGFLVWALLTLAQTSSASHTALAVIGALGDSTVMYVRTILEGATD
jgi:hypothetical protein